MPLRERRKISMFVSVSVFRFTHPSTEVQTFEITVLWLRAEKVVLSIAHLYEKCFSEQ